MRRLVLACAFAAVVAGGSTAEAGDWYRCMFGGGMCEGFCDYSNFNNCDGCRNFSCGDGCYSCPACTGCNAGMNGGFYKCPGCLESCGGGRCGNSARCGPISATCCASAPTCCAPAPSCCVTAAPTCCAPVACHDP